jgi:serine/threonine protein kinase
METHLSFEQIKAYLENRLDAEDDASAANHLESCKCCQSDLRNVEAARCSESVSGHGPLVPPSSLELQLRELAAAFSHSGGFPHEPPPKIDGYDILRFLGRGGMGKVFEAFDRSRREVVALKITKHQEFDRDEDIERFKQEAEAARLAGGIGVGVVPIYDVGECRGVHYLAMANIQGGTLASRAKQLREFPRASARLIEQVARAVSRLHEMAPALIHRDIKPENILLHPCPFPAALHTDAQDAARGVGTNPLASLDPLLSDFGLAKRQDQSGHTKSGQIIGTLDYMAPEQLEAANKPTPAMDIYALGGTLYFCLTGKAPLEASSPLSLIKRIERDYPSRPRTLNPRVPRDLQTICLKCLEKNPCRRYANAKELADDLRRFLDGQPIVARPPGPHRVAGRWCQSHPRLATAMLLGFVLLASAGLYTSARIQKLEAEANLQTEQRQRAEEVAAVQRQAAHDAIVNAARAAARRGDWRTALNYFQQAMDDAGPDWLRLRVERLFGFFAVNDRETLARELDDLAARTDLDRLGAMFHLVRGAYFLCDSTKQEEGRELVRKALRARDDLNFSPADAAFAEALADTRPRQVAERLRHAVRLDPLHFPANASLLVVLLGTGELDEARAQSDRMQGFFPDASLPTFIRALADLIEGNRPEMLKHLDELATRLGPDRVADMTRIRNYCELLANVLDLFERFNTNRGGLGFADNLKLGVWFGSLRSESWPALQPIAFPVPTMGVLFHSLNLLMNAYLETGTRSHEAAFQRLLAASADYPEALLLAMAAANRLVPVTGMINRGELQPSRELLIQVGRLSERAANAPTLIPRSPIRYQSRILCGIADVALLKIARDPSEAHLERLWGNLRRLVAEGRRWKNDRQEGLDLLLKMLICPLTKEQTTDWQPETPTGAEAFRRRNRHLYVFGRSLVENWLDDEPENKAAAKWLDDLRTWATQQKLDEPASRPTIP